MKNQILILCALTVATACLTLTQLKAGEVQRGGAQGEVESRDPLQLQAPVLSGSLRSAAVHSPPGGKLELGVSTRFRDDESSDNVLKVAVLTTEGESQSDDTLVMKWSVDIGAAGGGEPQLVRLNTKESSKPLFLVSSNEPRETTVLEWSTGAVTKILDGYELLDATQGGDDKAALILLGKESSIALFRGADELSSLPSSKLRMSGAVLSGYIHHSKQKEKTTLLIATQTKAKEGQESETASLIVWRIEVLSNGELGVAQPVFKADVDHPQSEAYLATLGEKGYLSLPSFNRTDGVVVPFELDSLAVEPKMPKKLIRDPDPNDGGGVGPRGFGSSILGVDGALLVSRPGDFERSALFAFEPDKLSLRWRIDYELGQNAGTKIIVTDDKNLFVVGGGVKNGALSRNGSLYRYRLSGNGKPALIDKLSQIDLEQTWVDFLKRE